MEGVANNNVAKNPSLCLEAPLALPFASRRRSTAAASFTGWTALEIRGCGGFFFLPVSGRLGFLFPFFFLCDVLLLQCCLDPY